MKKRLVQRTAAGFLAGLMLILASGCAGNSSPAGSSGTDTSSEAGSSGGGEGTDSNFNPTGWPVVNEKVNLKVYGSRSTNSPEDWNEFTIFKKMEETTNVHIEWELVESSTYTERRNVMINSGVYPDVIKNGLTVTELMRYGSEGVFIPQEDLQEKYCPQLMALYEEQEGLQAINTMPDGHIYSMPFLSDGPWTGLSREAVINTDWLEAVDMEMPTTLEEFEEVLIAFRDKDPNGNGKKDEIPLSWAGALNNTHVSGWGFGLNWLADSFQCPDPDSHLDVVDGKVTFVPMREEYKEWVKWLSGLYAEGLLDKNGFTQGTDQYAALLNSTPYQVGVASVWDIGDTFTDPDAYDHYAYLPPMKGLDGEDPTPYYSWYAGSSGNWAITSSCQIPEIAARVGDYCYDKDVSLEMFEGAIGERLVPCTVCNDGRALMVSDPPEGVDNTTFRVRCGPGGAIQLGVTREYYKERLHLHYTDAKVKFIDEEVRPIADKDSVPPLNYTVEESEIVNQVQTTVMDYVNRRAAEWVMNGKIEEEWDAYLKELENMNIDGWMEAAQKSYERFLEAVEE